MYSAKFWAMATAISAASSFSGHAVHAQSVPGFTDARLTVMNDARPRMQRENGMLVYDLATTDSIGRPKPGSGIPVMGYKDCNYPNGLTTNCDQAMGEVFLGPTIHAWKDQPIVVNVKNQNTKPEFFGPKVVHLHGPNTPQTSDGLPTQYILPNTTKRYIYPNALPSSTFWYHDHTMDRTHEFATAGLAGAFLLHDAAEIALNLPKNDQGLVLIIHTLQKDNYPACDNAVGTCVLVNGRERPYHDVKRQKYRLRVITATYYEEFSLKLKVLNAPAAGCQRRVLPGETETSYYQIGSDGGFLA